MGLKRIGYYKSWDVKYLPPEDINLAIYSHINYAFCPFNSDGELEVSQSDKGILKRLSKLKSRKSSLKLLLSIGGWNEGSAKFSSIGGDDDKIRNMAKSAISLFEKYDFDGLDIDWEYPGENGGSRRDKEKFVNMLGIIRHIFKKHYLLTIAVSPLAKSSSYNIAAIAEKVDFINVMTYDFHYPSQGKTGHNAPLYASSKDSEWEKENSNCYVAIKKWIKGGAPASKVVLGLAFYGQEFDLEDETSHRVGSKTETSGGTKTYREISKLQSGWETRHDSNSMVPYMFKGYKWISYDDPESIKAKVQFARKKHLGGVMVWAMNDDDEDELTLAMG